MKRLSLWVLLLLALVGCAPAYTTFEGGAKIKDGPSGCEAKCKEWGMELVGMVALGEYSDGCICKKKGSQLSMSDIGETLILSSSGSGGGTVGVETARRQEANMAAGMVAAMPLAGF
jgi:hypothetical protein